MPHEEQQPGDASAHPEDAARDAAFNALLREIAEAPRLPPELMRTVTFEGDHSVELSPSPFGRRLPGIGEIIDDRYLVQNELGRGGMGVVFGARNMRTQREVALKWMLPRGLTRSAAERHDSVERFVREARAVSRIDHPNVVRVLDVGGDPEMPYLVMERLEGESLRSRLLRSKLSWDEALAVLQPVLEGVAAAHRAGVIHRDLKPDNIFLCTDMVKVLDFGVSRIGGDEDHTTLTRTGTMLGTPAYMPLEQLRGSREVDERTDVYALGVILFEALSGRLPFDAQTPADQAVLLATRPPEPLSELSPELRGPRSEAVMKALARKPSDRYPSVDAMRHALAGAAAARSPLRARRALAFALVLVAAAIAIAFWPRAAPSARPVRSVQAREIAPAPPPAAASVPSPTPPPAAPQLTPEATAPAASTAETLTRTASTPTPRSPGLRRAPAPSAASSPSPASPTALSVEQFRAGREDPAPAPFKTSPVPRPEAPPKKPPALSPSEF